MQFVVVLGSPYTEEDQEPSICEDSRTSVEPYDITSNYHNHHDQTTAYFKLPIRDMMSLISVTCGLFAQGRVGPSSAATVATQMDRIVE